MLFGYSENLKIRKFSFIHENYSRENGKIRDLLVKIKELVSSVIFIMSWSLLFGKFAHSEAIK